jgi:hypothetical protein
MANWCSNKVEFIGEDSQFEQLASLFQAMAKNEKKDRRGQLPDFAESSDTGYFFEIAWENGILYYQTKWSPNRREVMRIAIKYGVGFIHSYDEPGNLVFGETQYLNGVFTDIDLDTDDFAQYEYDDDTNTYRFENQNHEGTEDILQTLLERKKALHKQQCLNPTENDQFTTI